RLVSCRLVLECSIHLMTDTPAPQIPPFSVHDALPISQRQQWQDQLLILVCPVSDGRLGSLIFCSLGWGAEDQAAEASVADGADRSEEHTSELQSRENLVCRLLLEKKKQLL